jgi:hypothetical protein
VIECRHQGRHQHDNSYHLSESPIIFVFLAKGSIPMQLQCTPGSQGRNNVELALVSEILLIKQMGGGLTSKNTEVNSHKYIFTVNPIAITG